MIISGGKVFHTWKNLFYILQAYVVISSRVPPSHVTPPRTHPV